MRLPPDAVEIRQLILPDDPIPPADAVVGVGFLRRDEFRLDAGDVADSVTLG